MSGNIQFIRSTCFATLAIILTCTGRLPAQNTIQRYTPSGTMPSYGYRPGSVGPAMTSAEVNAGTMRYPETAAPTTNLSPTNTDIFEGANSTQPDTSEPEQPLYFEENWTWQFLPDGLLYKSYLAGGREPRISAEWVHIKDQGWLWDVTLGGRAGIIRYGTTDTCWPEGWQVDIEGAAFPRLNLDENRDLEAVDFRFGVPLTVRRGPWQGKFAYYHYSSHLGDEYMVRNNTLSRTNFSRDSLVLGVGLFLNPNLRLYSEADYAFYADGGSDPWSFQFGAEYSPIEPTRHFGAPFLAVNGRLHEEVDYGGNVSVQTGWQWRGQSGHLFRLGAHYLNGMSDQSQFFNRFEEQIGVGMWYDF